MCDSTLTTTWLDKDFRIAWLSSLIDDVHPVSADIEPSCMIMKDYLIPLDTPCVYYKPELFSKEQADEYYKDLLHNIKWEKTSKINRWVALHEELPEGDDSGYRYRDAPNQQVKGSAEEGSSVKEGSTSNSQLNEPEKVPFTNTISKIQDAVQDWYREQNPDAPHFEFNVCLLNFYEDGNQRIGWHCDREEIGRTTPIASISLGAPRQFQIRAKEHSALDKATIDMEHGSLIIMENVCQERYLHCVPKQSEVTQGRINLTFRCKTQTTAGEEEHERRDKFMDRIQEYVDESSTAVDGVDAKVPPGAYSCSSPSQHSSAVVFGNAFLDRMDRNDIAKSSVKYTVSTNGGAECYTAAEITEILERLGLQHKMEIWPRPWSVVCYVLLATANNLEDAELTTEERSNLETSLLKMRSVHHVMIYHDSFDLQEAKEFHNKEYPDNPVSSVSKLDGEALYQFYKRRMETGTASIPTLNEPKSFRVCCHRIGGSHAFRHPEVEREIGGAISEVHPGCPPKMSDYEVCIRVDVICNQVLVGTQLNIDDLSKRQSTRFRNKVSIKRNLAYAMLKLANLEQGHTVLDPFCGGGTILLEALEMTERKVQCIGLDVSRKAAQGAQENARAEGFGPESIQFHCADARALRRFVKDDSVDAIVTNLPWGVMTGNKKVNDLQTIYEIFLRSSWYILKNGGRIVVLVLRGLQMARIIQKLSGRYKLLSANIVRTTNNLPCLMVIEKLASDKLHDSIKSQLAYMSQYVNVSREMYHALHMENIDAVATAEENPKT